VSSLDAIAAQLTNAPGFQKINANHFVIAIDARMEEVYWARYQTQCDRLPKRLGDIHLSKPEDIDLQGIEYLAGSAIVSYRERLPSFNGILEPEISISALGVMDCARNLFAEGLHMDVRQLEPLYVRNKVALTTAERIEAFK